MLGTPVRTGLIASVSTFLLLALIMNVQARSWLVWYRLATSGEKTTAKITSQNPTFHDMCGFEYRIDSHRYAGSQGGCGLAVGESVEVIYLPSEPSFATMRSPVYELLFRIGASLMLALLAGFISAWRVPRGAPPL